MSKSSALMARVDELIRAGQWGSALEFLNYGGDAFTATKDTLLRTAECLRNLDRIEEAAALLSRPSAIPPDPDLYTMLGRLHRDLKQYQSAMDAFRFALRIDPESAEAHCQVGILSEHAGEHRVAYLHFRKAAILCPDDGVYQLCLGKAARLVGHAAEADRALAKARCRLTPSRDRRSLYNLACLECLQGNLDAARQAIEKCVEVAPYVLYWARSDPDMAPLFEPDQPPIAGHQPVGSQQPAD